MRRAIDAVRDLFAPNLLTRIVAVVVALAVLGAGAWFAWDSFHPDRSCAAGVERTGPDDECVGVSGDGFAFGNEQLKPVSEAIARENDTLEPGTYATVAVMMPFDSDDPVRRAKIVHSVEGAYLQQYRANHESNGERPPIRLVLANTGKEDAHWRPVVDRLVAMTDGPDRLRAVTGVATSGQGTKDAVAALTARHVPVVGTTITADDIANNDREEPFPGLARVVPTNRDEARALTHFGRTDPRKSLLVHDRNPGDRYAGTLRDVFNRLLADSPYQPQPIDSTDLGSTASTARQIALFVCGAKDAENVFFAGRHAQLREFINALSGRPCQDRPVTVLTGDEGSYLGGDPGLDRSAVRHKVTVRYTALAHPDAWRGSSAPPSGGSRGAYETFARLAAKSADLGIGPLGHDDLTDGQAIVAYDAMATVVQGIRTPDPGHLPKLVSVANEWPRLMGPQKVEGAGGWICLDVHGNPYNKAVPIMELSADGTPVFVRLSWPEGRPPTDCIPPR
ncbi:hypothetical protein [Streptomyces caatingaensis]|uniref:Leucine-binding protein domain-containing protein n=1 Tax=Streptomyces caatingaensis TaxID=1678637 RepID=A0A0K9XCI8_9ACTN|nr:hypothetical protein [Streptomyces caatingaensis]KNB50918.1 hypothetical protein AC230_19210 [Streptomyces caatingaensis]